MDWLLFRAALVNLPEYHEQPQLVRRLDIALAELRSGLEYLASRGHVFHLAEGPGPSDSAKWPRLVFHLEKAPRGFSCLCEQDFDLLGGHAGGWHDTLDEAKHSAGMDKQFQRGGIFPRSGLPALVPEDKG